MQAHHFFFGLGVFFAPLIAKPFLATQAGFKVKSTSANKKAPTFIPLSSQQPHKSSRAFYDQ
jgi:hypothetical protein